MLSDTAMRRQTLPIGLNRISWKLVEVILQFVVLIQPLPIGLNRISWKPS